MLVIFFIAVCPEFFAIFSFNWAFSKLLNADLSHLSKIWSFNGVSWICLMRVISKYFSASFLDAKTSNYLLSSSKRDSSHGFKNKPFLGWYKGRIGVLPLSLLGPELDEQEWTCLNQELQAMNFLLLACHPNNLNNQVYKQFHNQNY